MPRAKQRTPELREHVLRVALAVLSSEGPSALTTRRLAERAGTSTPAVYELFGDKGGLLRELFFEGFLRLRAQLEALPATEDPRRDLEAFFGGFRAFVRDNPVLAQLMYSQPFGDFDPRPHEAAAGEATRRWIVERVRRAVDGGQLLGDVTDLAHVVLALAQGLAAQEAAGWLGSTASSVDRRWDLAVRVVLDGAAVAPAELRRGRP